MAIVLSDLRPSAIEALRPRPQNLKHAARCLAAMVDKLAHGEVYWLAPQYGPEFSLGYDARTREHVVTVRCIVEPTARVAPMLAPLDVQSEQRPLEFYMFECCKHSSASLRVSDGVLDCPYGETPIVESRRSRRCRARMQSGPGRRNARSVKTSTFLMKHRDRRVQLEAAVRNVVEWHSKQCQTTFRLLHEEGW